MSDPEKPEAPAKPKRDPAALSSEYHKAHKQLMLWSTILLIWELIGVDLSKAKDAGGNVGPIVTALKSPQAVPWALTGLVVYFLFKCSVEWAQCPADRRRHRFARIDFISAWIVALAAVALYIGQAISKVQFADLITGRNRISLLIGFMFGVALAVSGSNALGYRKSKSGINLFKLIASFVWSVLIIVPALLLEEANWKAIWLAAAVPILVSTASKFAPLLLVRFFRLPKN